MALAALYPHYETGGTSGVSLFYLNREGATVYHAPKNEPIFSIILSSVVCLQSTSADTTVWQNILCLCIMLSLFLYEYQHESR